MFYYHHLKLTLTYVTFSKLNLFFKKIHTYRFFFNKKTLNWVIFNFNFWKKETFIFRVTRFNPNLCGNLSSILGEKVTYIQVKSGNSENKSSSGNSKWPESMWHSLLYIRRESYIYSGQILKKDLQK